MRHRGAIAGLAALAVISGGTLLVAACTARAPVTTGLASAAAATFSPPLPSAISCGSVRSCLAVGDDSTDYTGNEKLLSWNGSTWKALTVPVPQGVAAVGLTAASCESAGFCLAVGNTIPNLTADITGMYAVSWNGTKLKITATAPVPPGYSSAAFSAVSCLTARDCVAPGYATNAAGNTVDFAETWNGSTWTLHVIAQPTGTHLAFDAISCVSATYCVLAGDNGLGAVASAYVGTAYAGVWNGKSLTAQNVPVPAKASTGLTGVSCVSKSRCAAAGFGLTSAAGTRGFGITETWNGKVWKPAEVPTPEGQTLVRLDDVSCAAATACTAVGMTGFAGNRAEAFFYNGKTWVRQVVPNPGDGKVDEFEGVSCPKASDCVAIGEVWNAAGATSALAGYWNGRAWKLAAA